ncbi:MAG: anhydro-N-acetylmuramic acid kinase, partial [Gemmatimonadaceae bacterium]
MTDAGRSVYVGLMSGTSLDGISAAAVRFVRSEGHIGHQLLAFNTIAYSSAQRERLAAAMRGGTAAEYCSLSFELGDWLATAAGVVIKCAGIETGEVRAIASHGQTVWHTPRRSTWQIGESAVIAERTGIDVVSDFRVRDVAAGGEGAPLVPIADAMLYADRTEWRVLQNIGGIANLTIVPPGGSLAGMRAFDTGPGVVLIDHCVRALYPGLRYDEGGAIARSGHVHGSVVAELMRDAYFAQVPPKSTGREYFGAAFADRLMSMLGDCPAADVIATVVALTAATITDAIRRFVPASCRDVLVSGGGARNAALTDALRVALLPRRLLMFED